MTQVSSTAPAPTVFTVTLADGTTVTHNNGAFVITQPDESTGGTRSVRIQRSQVPAFLQNFLTLYNQWRGLVEATTLELRRLPGGLHIGDGDSGVLIGRPLLDDFLDALIAQE